MSLRRAPSSSAEPDMLGSRRQGGAIARLGAVRPCRRRSLEHSRCLSFALRGRGKVTELLPRREFSHIQQRSSCYPSGLVVMKTQAEDQNPGSEVECRERAFQMSELLLGKSNGGAGSLACAQLPGSDTAQARSQQPEATPRIIAIIEPTLLVRESLVQLVDEALPHFSARPSTLTLQDLLRDASVALIIKRSDSGEPIDPAPRAVSSQASPPVLAIVPNDDAREALRYFQAGYRGVFPSTEKAATLIAAIQVLLAGCFFCPSSFVCECLQTSGP